MDNRVIGRLGEDIACEYLEGVGYEILKRNYTTKCGEIDIVAAKESALHFVEVKTRTQNAYGRPAEAIGPGKLERITRSAAAFISAEKPDAMGYSFDAIEISLNHITGII